MRVREIENSDSNLVFASKVINHGDWPFHFLIVVDYLDRVSREWAEKSGNYHVAIHVASAEACADKCQRVVDTIGETLETFQALPYVQQCRVVQEYGYSAALHQNTGNNLRTLLRAARKELKVLDFMFGFYMDRPINAMGATGWDFVKGEFIPQGLETMKAVVAHAAQA